MPVPPPGSKPVGLDLEGPRLQEAGRKAGGHGARAGALPRGKASFSRAFRVGGPLEPLPCGALEGSGGREQGTVGGDLTFPCSSYQAGPEARVVVGVLPGCSGRLTSHGGQEAQSQRPPLKS